MGTRIMNQQISDPFDPQFRSSIGGREESRFRSQQPASDPHFLNSQPPRIPQTSQDQIQRFAGLGVGVGSVCAEYLLSHPCIVIRRQCQVHHSSQWYHTQPFTLFQVIFNIQRHQSLTTLWKGLGSTFIIKGTQVVTESAISEFTPLPKEVSKHSSLKKLAQHVVLKGLGFLVITPFYAASLVETVQSEIASERPGVLDCLREGATRLVGWNTSQTTRLLPIWKLLLPSAGYLMSRYITTSLAAYTVNLSMQTEQDVKQDGSNQSMYQVYYPQLVATFTGNLIADVMLYPMETILHRLCVQGTRTIIDNTDTGLGVVPIITRYEGFFDCLKNIISEEGFSGLYKGFGMVFIQYAIHLMLLKVARFLFEQLASSHPPKRVRFETPEDGARGGTMRHGMRDMRPGPSDMYRQSVRDARLGSSDMYRQSTPVTDVYRQSYHNIVHTPI